MKKRKINKYSKLGILLIGILFTMSNCDKDHLTETSSKEKLFTPEPIATEKLFQTVSIDESKEFFKKRKHEQALNRIVDPLELEPDLEGIHQEYFLQSEELITIIPAETKYPMIETNILQVKSLDGEIHSLLFNEIPDINSSSSEYFTGIISITTLEGRFIEAYRLEEGIAISELSIPTTYSNQCNENLDPWSIFCFQQLPEVQITSTRTNFYTTTSYFSGSIANNYFFNYFNNSYYAYAEGYMKYLEYLNTFNKPCAGDPIKNPQIAPQTNSGIQGGLHDTCVRVVIGEVCNGIVNRKFHDGVDIKNPYGEPIYAMYDGTAVSGTEINIITGKTKGAGYYVSITSIINGETVRLVYFHLQEANRKSGLVKQGDIIGYQGNSGNLKNALEQKLTESHVHIKASVNKQRANPLDFFKTKIDSKTGQVTTPCK